MKQLEAEEIAMVSGGAVEVVQGEQSWLGAISSAIREFFGSDTSAAANNAFTGVRG